MMVMGAPWEQVRARYGFDEAELSEIRAAVEAELLAAPQAGVVGVAAHDAGMNAIFSTTLYLPAPCGDEMIRALAIIAGTEVPDWIPATVSGNPAGMATVRFGDSRIELVQGQAPASAPEQLALQVHDAEAAVARLTNAGFTVETVDDPKVAGHLSVGGVRLLVVAADA